MGKRITAFFLLVILAAGLTPAAVFAADGQQDYELRTLDFEGAYWDALIDEPQYGGPLLYGESGNGMDEPYRWADEATGLSHSMLPSNSYGPGVYCYWSYGEAISNYASGAISEHGDYMNQLTVYKEGENDLVRTGGGHNGSNNFVVHYGYADTSGYGLGESYLPRLTFTNGPHVIDHMYIKLTDYLLQCIVNGNDLTSSMGDDDVLYVRAIGYDADGNKTNEVRMNVCEGQNLIVKDWTMWDLSELGAVSSVALEINGSSNNGYGFSQPAYFAFDDVAVRIPKSEAAQNKIEVNDGNGLANIEIGGATVKNVAKADGENGPVYNVVLAKDTAADAKVSVKFTADSQATGAKAVKFNTRFFEPQAAVNRAQAMFGSMASTTDYAVDLDGGVGNVAVYCYNMLGSCLPDSASQYRTLHTLNFTIEGSCKHEATETAYEAIDGQEKHTVTVTCKTCNEQVGEAATEDCVDADKNGKCDKCDGDVVVPAWHDSLFKINGINFSVEEKKLTSDPIDSQFAGTYLVHLDMNNLKTADWEITMPDGSPVGYAQPYSSESWTGISYTVRQSWKTKTLAAQVKANTLDPEKRYLVAPQSLDAPKKATLGNYAQYILVCFDDKYINEAAHETIVSASGVTASTVSKKLAMTDYSDVLTPQTLDAVFETTDPYFHYSNTSGYTHTWTYTTGTGKTAVTHTIPAEGISYEEIQKLLKNGVFSVKLTNESVPYRYIVDWNGGDRSDAVPTWYVGKVGDFDANYWADTLTAEQYEKYKDCYFGYYSNTGASYVWYDANTDTVYTEKNKSADSKLVTTIPHEDANDETFAAYLPRPFAEGAICSGWDLTYLNERGKCAKDAKTRQAKLGNAQPQQIRSTSSSTPIFGDVVVTAQYSAEGSVVFALPKATDTYSVTAKLANVDVVAQPLKNNAQIVSFTKVEKDYDENYDYFALLLTDYQDIWFNKANSHYIVDPAKSLYLETADGKVYLDPMASTSATNGSPRYHLTKVANGKDARPAFAAASENSSDKVVYLHVEDGAVKAASVKVGLQMFEEMVTGRAKQKGTGREFRYCDFNRAISESEGYTIEFFDADGNKVDGDTFDWGTTVRAKVMKDGKDYSSRVKLHKSISPVIVINGLEGFDTADTVAVEQEYLYTNMGESVHGTTTLYCDNELTLGEDGFFTYQVDRIFDIPVSSKVEAVYLRGVPTGPNQEAIEAVEAEIAKIDAVVTESSAPQIEAARAAYDALFDDEKALVKNAAVLEKAEAALMKLDAEDLMAQAQEAMQTAQAAQAAADAAQAQVDADKLAVEAAQKTAEAAQAAAEAAQAKADAAQKAADEAQAKADADGKNAADAQAAAEAAQAKADAAQAAADKAQAKAEAAQAAADAAQAKVNEAEKAVEAAQKAADDAMKAAQEAQKKADSDKADVEAAKKAVEEAQAKAEAAQAAADKAQAKADADAKSVAAAQEKAEAAQAAAEAAQAKADAAQAAADKAQAAADESQAKADADAKDAQAAQEKADAAQAAADKAQAKADKAQAEAEAAQKTAGDAQAKADDALKKAKEIQAFVKKSAKVKKLTAKKKAAKASVKKVKGATGYQIRYSTKSSMKKAKKVTTSKLTKKIKKLKKGKKYYVQVRAYKVIDGEKYYTAYSAMKAVKIKK